MTVTQQTESNATAERPSHEAFEAAARSFLDANAVRRPEETFVWGEGSDNVSLFP